MLGPLCDGLDRCQHVHALHARFVTYTFWASDMLSMTSHLFHS
jgi:hypothetical protein